MYDKILIPTDGSDDSARALAHGIALAETTGATLHGLYVVDFGNIPMNADDVEDAGGPDAVEEAGREILTGFADQCEDAGVEAVTVLRIGTPVEEIAVYTTDHEIDLLVLGAHRRQGLARFLSRSLTEQLLHVVSVPVLAVHADEGTETPTYETILVAVDGRRGTVSAINHALTFAETFDATVHAVYVLEAQFGGSSSLWDALESEGRQAVKAVEVQGAKQDVEVVTDVVEGEPPEALREYATRHDLDLVVLGTQGRTGLDAVVVGSVAKQMIRKAHLPVLAVRNVQESNQ